MQKLIKGLAITAGVWSAFPWAIIAVLFLFGAVLPDPGSIISFKVPWWAVIVVWSAEPLLWFLLWKAPQDWKYTLGLTAFVGCWFAIGLWKASTDLMAIWLGPTVILLPFLFYGHLHGRRP